MAEQMKKKGNSHAWMALIAMSLTALYVGGIGWNCISLYFDPIISEWGITRTEVSVTVLILSTIHMVIATFFFGQLASRLGIRKMIVIGGCLNAAGFALFAMSSNVPMLYAASALFGTGIGFTSNSTYNTAMTSWFAKNQSTMISIIATVSSVTGIVSATVVGLLINTLGWRMGFWATFAICIVCTVVAFVLYKGEPSKIGELPMYAEEVLGSEAAAEKEEGITFKRMLSSIQGWLLILGWLLIGIVGYFVQGNLALFAVDYGYGDFSGTLLSVSLACCAIYMPVAGRLCDKLGSKSVVFIGMIAVIVNCIVLRIPDLPLPVLYGVAILSGFSWDANIVPVAKCILEAFGNLEFQKKVGVLVGMQAFGVALAPTVINLFYDLGGHTYSLGLIVMALLSALVMVLFVFGTRRVKDEK